VSKSTDAKDRAKLARRHAAVYKACVDLASLVEEIEGHQPAVKVELAGDGFTVSAGRQRFGAKSSGL